MKKQAGELLSHLTISLLRVRGFDWDLGERKPSAVSAGQQPTLIVDGRHPESG